MASTTKRLSVVYQGDVPRRLSDLVLRQNRCGLAKEGLCDFPPVRACRLIITMEWENSPLDHDIYLKLLKELRILKASGIILDFDTI